MYPKIPKGAFKRGVLILHKMINDATRKIKYLKK